MFTYPDMLYLFFIFYPLIVHQGFWYLHSGQNSTAYFDTTAASFGGSKAAKPVRLYCDICEEFDKHDTDDCPLQEGDGGSNFAVKNDKWDPNSYDDDDETF